MEDKAKKEVNEGITAYAKRMRELAGLADGNQNKSLKTVQEGVSSFDGGAKFMAKDFMTSNDKTKEVVKENKEESENKEDFETHKFEQRKIEEGEDDEELYTLNENTIIVLNFLNNSNSK